MKKILIALLGMFLIGNYAYAEENGDGDFDHVGNTSAKGQAHKKHDPQEVLAKINMAISKREAQLQKVTGKGKTDIAAAIQKVIADLNKMKTALNSKDEAAFKAANEQRKKDREALEALIKSERGNKTGKKAASTTSTSASTSSSSTTATVK